MTWPKRILLAACAVAATAIASGVAWISVSTGFPRAFYLTSIGEALTLMVADHSGAHAAAGSKIYRIGELAPQLRLKGLDGNTLAFGLGRGRKLLMNFWATWCAPCVVEMSELERVALQRKIDIVGISQDGDSARVRKLLDRKPVSYPIALDSEPWPRNYLAAFGGHQGQMPFSVLVDEEGRIVRAHLGAFGPGDLDRWLDR